MTILGAHFVHIEYIYSVDVYSSDVVNSNAFSSFASFIHAVRLDC